MTKTIGSIPAEKLLGMEMDLFSKLRSGALTIRQLEMFLKKQNPFLIPTHIQLGTLRTGGKLRDAIRNAGGEVNPYAFDLMLRPEFSVSPTVTEVKLVTVTAAELRFKSPTTRELIYQLATSKYHNLQLCPPEVGPQLRLQYVNQPLGEDLQIAMEPIKDHGSRFGNIFAVSNLSATAPPHLNSYDGDPDRVWELTDTWVFLAPN